MDSDGPPGRSSTNADGRIPTGAEVVREIEGVELSPDQHQRVKDIVHGEQLRQIKNHDRRYLIVGAGNTSGAASRRQTVSDRLDARTNPDAMATQLEDYGLTTDDIELWVHVFDILCGMVTSIVAVIEDFDGGYTWELGLLFAPEYRPKAWVLKRKYPDADVERRRYDNGMAASHVKLLLTGERCIEWMDSSELGFGVEKIP